MFTQTLTAIPHPLHIILYLIMYKHNITFFIFLAVFNTFNRYETYVNLINCGLKCGTSFMYLEMKQKEKLCSYLVQVNFKL